MPYRLEFTGRATKDIRELDTVVRRRIAAKLKFFIAQDDPLAFAKQLTSLKDGDYRWRVGPYRLVFDVDGQAIVLLHVQHRSQVYKR